MKQHRADARHHANREQPAQQGVPEGWIITPLSEVVRPSNKKLEPSASPDSRYLSLEHIEQDSGRILGYGTAGEVRSTKAVFCAGDVLYGKLRPYLNKVCTPDFDGICSTDILVFPRSALVESGYLFRFLMRQSTVEHAHHHSSGVQLPRVSFEKLGQISFPLPPLAEQRRIVARVEALLGRVQAARARLAKVPALLKRFRQSVLAAACCGELAGEWREGEIASEPPSKLLQRIHENRVASYEAKCRSARASGEREPRRPTNLEIQQRTPSTDLELPVHWLWLSFEDIASSQQHAMSSGPFGSALGSKDYQNSGVPVIRGQNIQAGRFVLKDFVYVSERKADDLARSSACPGDIVVVAVGSSGQASIVPKELPRAVLSQNCNKITVDSELALPSYVILCMQNEMSLSQMREMTTDTARPFLSLTNLKSTVFPVPPLAEQHEIVRHVEALFALADKIESRVALATERVEKTTQAILAKAFRGELVPTEAELARQQNRDYEPATALLERIRAERRIVEKKNVSSKAARRKQRKVFDRK